MTDDGDYELGHHHWEALKALRTPSRPPATSLLALADLVVFGLATVSGDLPTITPQGRKALVRGSFRLLDAAA